MIRPRQRNTGYDLQLFVWAAVNFCFLSLLGLPAVFREQPLFWRNAGGRPVWLRDFVAAWFYPLFGLELIFLVVFSVACFDSSYARGTVGRSAILTLPALWGLLFFILAVVAANNLENLLHGRPLHWHAG